MKRSERNWFKEQRNKAEHLVECLEEFAEDYRDRPISFDNLNILIATQSYKGVIKDYILQIKDKLRPKK